MQTFTYKQKKKEKKKKREDFRQSLGLFWVKMSDSAFIAAGVSVQRELVEGQALTMPTFASLPTSLLGQPRGADSDECCGDTK